MHCETPICQKWWTCCALTFQMLCTWSAVFVRYVTNVLHLQSCAPARPAVQVPHTQGVQIYCSPVRATGLTACVKSSTSEKNTQISPTKASRKKKKGTSWGKKKIQPLCYLKTSCTIVAGVFIVLSRTGIQCALSFSWVAYDNPWQDWSAWNGLHKQWRGHHLSVK